MPEEENQSKGIEHMLKISSTQLSWNKRPESIFERVSHVPENIDLERPMLRYILVKQKIIWACRKRKHMTYKGEKIRISLDFFTAVLYMPQENGVTYLGFPRKEESKNFVSRKTTPAISPDTNLVSYN